MANDIATADVGLALVVETASGKLRGARGDGIHSFKGVPYGTSTAGGNRFMPPRPPQPWAGVRDALTYAGHAPQSPNRPKRRPELETILGPADPTPEGEDCLTLNVWTPGLGNGGRRPVMVWLHGGGFAYGSGNRAVTDGANLARRGDVVVVSVNHRLNILGHLHLADLGGPEWAHSGNAGVLDLVAALQWVRDNIEQFGGDPGRVTIFGESGGGGKVSVLLAMPAARGLFHRAIVQSGAAVRVSTRERANALAEAVLKELGLGRGECELLQTMPIERLLAAMAPAAHAVGRTRWPLLDRYDFGPAVTGGDLPQHPGEPGAPALADDIPLLIGGTREESAFFLANDDAVWNGTLGEEDLRQRVAAVAGAETEPLLAAYRVAMPQASPRRPADRGVDRLELLDPHSIAGRALCGAASGAGLHVLARLAQPGPWRPPEGAPCDGFALCLRQSRCAGHNQRRCRRPRAGRADLCHLDRLRPQRQPRPSGDPALARLYRRGPCDDDPRHRVPRRARPGPRGAPVVDPCRRSQGLRHINQVAASGRAEHRGAVAAFGSPAAGPRDGGTGPWRIIRAGPTPPVPPALSGRDQASATPSTMDSYPAHGSRYP